jgi:hypothetical protein
MFMAEQNTFEVVPEDTRNPFRATVISILRDTEFEYGTIRIVPPVTIGEALLRNAGGAGDHDLRFWATGETAETAATLIDFQQKDEVYSGALDGRDRIAATAHTLLRELGGLASSDLI